MVKLKSCIVNLLEEKHVLNILVIQVLLRNYLDKYYVILTIIFGQLMRQLKIYKKMYIDTKIKAIKK